MKAAVRKELKNLEKVAVRQGYLTYDQLEDTLSLDMADPVALVDAIDDAFLKLGELKIEVFDSEEDALRKIRALRRPEAQKEAAKQVGDITAPLSNECPYPLSNIQQPPFVLCPLSFVCVCVCLCVCVA